MSILEGVTLTINGTEQTTGLPDGLKLAKFELYVDGNGNLYVGLAEDSNPKQVRALVKAGDFSIDENATASGTLTGDNLTIKSFNINDLGLLVVDLSDPNIIGSSLPENAVNGQIFFKYAASGD